MTTKRPKNITTTENLQPVHHPQTGEVLGNILSRVYDGENVQRHSFITDSREYSLGPTTEAFAFYDWPTLFGPLFDEGFQLEKLKLSRGGLRVFAHLSNPNAPMLKDPIAWDRGTWGKSLGLRESITFWGGIRPGTGFHYSRGFFRLVCTNGLVIETLRLGSVDFTHKTFSQDTLASSLFGRPVTVGGDTLVGEQVGTVKGLKKTQEVIARVIDNPEQLDSIPHFVRELVSPVAELPSAFMSEAFQQFEQLIQNAGRKEVYEMDLANALTSAENRLESAPARLAFKILPAQRSLAKLTGVFSL